METRTQMVTVTDGMRRATTAAILRIINAKVAHGVPLTERERALLEANQK